MQKGNPGLIIAIPGEIIYNAIKGIIMKIKLSDKKNIKAYKKPIMFSWPVVLRR